MVTSADKTAILEDISIHPPRRLLFGPGPSQVHPRVYKAIAQPIVGHLDPYFFEVSKQCSRFTPRFSAPRRDDLCHLGYRQQRHGNRHQQLRRAGTKVAVLANGYFCDRMTEMAKRQGAEIVRLEKPWGEFFTEDEAADFIQREKPQVVMYVQAETSTGVFRRGKDICEAAHEVGALVIADCVTSLGAMPVEVDDTGIDIAYSCTQKGLSCPPGLSPITVSARAAEWLQTSQGTNHSWYFDLN